MKTNGKFYLIIVMSFLCISLINQSNANPTTIYGRDFYRLIKTNSCPRCNLYKAPLANIDLTDANLTGANLTKADLRSATLYQAKIAGANLSRANLEGAIWVDGSTCQKGSIGRCIKEQTQ